MNFERLLLTYLHSVAWHAARVPAKDKSKLLPIGQHPACLQSQSLCFTVLLLYHICIRANKGKRKKDY